ncbi:MAG: fibronectin type III domain-containing protein [Candidatus Helarchaeota archaeon]
MSVWYNNQTDHQYISVWYDSTGLRLLTGVRVTYRTANLLSPMADCNVSYKFESGEYVYYDDTLPNTMGNNWTHSFYCAGDTFLMTNASFYIDFGCASDDPYIQVGFDNDHSGHSMYSLNGGPWTTDDFEYLVEAVVEDVSLLEENVNVSGTITEEDDFVDGYKVSLLSADTCHFYLESQTGGESFNLRLFPVATRITGDGNALWLEEGPTDTKSHQFDAVAGEYVVLVEPHVDGVDNGSYNLYWTYNPAPPELTSPPPIDADGNIQLSWNASPDSDLAYYNVYRGSYADFPLTPSNLISIPGSVTGTSFEDQVWLPDGQYYYCVTAVDDTGHESEKSNIVNISVLDSTAPQTPVLDAPEQSPIDSDGLIYLNWSAPTDTDVELFRLYRADYSGFPLNTSYLIVTLNSTSYQDYAFLNGTYFYRVTAVDEKSLESTGSNEVQTTVIDIVDPDPPVNLTYRRIDDLIVLNWTASTSPDLSHYYIYCTTSPLLNGSLPPIANTTTSSWIGAKPPPGKYYYRIVAVDLNRRETSTREKTCTANTILYYRRFRVAY